MENKIQFLFMIFAFPVVLSIGEDNKYCRIPTCNPGTHTLCLYPKNQPHNRCGRIIRSGLTKNERTRILEVHNDFRTRVFSGQEERGNPGPQLPAAKVVPLEWNDKLAVVAQRWSDQCLNISDTCRNMDCAVGQNFILSEYDEDINEDLELLNLQWLIGFWYQEVERFNSNHVHGFRENVAEKAVTFHYTQMVWGKTTEIGCGVTRYTDSDDAKIFIVCNYAPSGNINRELVYSLSEDGEGKQD